MSEVLVLGSGGREQAIAQAMYASPEVSRVEISANPKLGLEKFSGKEKPFVVVGPEALLLQGITDELRESGYTVFGATKAMAEYEGSKSYAIRMMRKAGVPHPNNTEALSLHAALRYVYTHHPETYVIKADRPAGGKGVILPKSTKEALETTHGMRSGELFDGAGERITNYQIRRHGPEVSDIVIVGTEGQKFRLALTQDHKKLGNNDTGKNTGGMGAYGPVPETVVSKKQQDEIEEIEERSLWGMRQFGVPYERAALYTGLILPDTPEVLEYNVRFGDPEAQVQFLLAIKAGIDMYRVLRSAAEGNLEVPQVDFSKLGLAAITICLAVEGYPDDPIKGDNVWGLENDYGPDVTIQQAAVSSDGKTDGTRAVYSTAATKDIDSAAELGYSTIDLKQEGPSSGKIGFRGMQVRTDIAWQARLR